MNEDEYSIYTAINFFDDDWTPEASEALRKVIEKHQPKTHIETRIRYIINKDVYPGYKWNEHNIHDWTGDGWSPGTVDGVASYPWMMNTCIVWLEERIVYEPEPWVVNNHYPGFD